MNKLLKKSCLVNAVINLIELLGIGIVLFLLNGYILILNTIILYLWEFAFCS